MNFRALVFLAPMSLLASSLVHAEVTHYRIVAEYKAKTVIAFHEDGGQAIVKDKYVLDLDYDLRTSKVVGPIKIQNFKSEVSDLQNVEKSCPAPSPPKGPYEHFDILEAKDIGNSQLELKGTRSYPAIDVTADCQGSWHKRSVSAKLVPVTELMGLIDLEEGTFKVPDTIDWTWVFTATPKN